ncbi:MAG: VanW family protein [Eubacterium sp.]|nr:VanW family protein [Eubacterium sp.]
MRKTGMLCASLFLLAVVALFPQNVYAAEEGAGILDGVSVGAVYVGGMDEESAKAAIEAYVSAVEAGSTYLVGDIGEVEVENSSFGITYDVDAAVENALSYGTTGNLISRYKQIKDAENGGCTLDMNIEVDEEATTTVFDENASELENEPVNYGLKRENGSFTIIEGSNGTKINNEESISALNTFLNTAWSSETNSFTLITEEAEPEGSPEELAKVTDLLGSYSTDYSSSSWGRAQNVANGTSKINGTVVYPGEQFSVHDAVNPMTAENGYELAGSYENGTTVESYGGGICQVSTTLYNAVLMAELQVDERYAHSMIVSYVSPSRDAAMAGDYKDLKFTNNTDAPIYIEGYTSGGYIYFNIYGEEYRDSSHSVEYESETLTTTEPETEFVADSSLEVGTITQTQSPHTGYTAQLWKIVYENGVEVSRTVWNSSTYTMSPRIYSVGIKSDSKEAVAAMKKAIATGDEDTIREAAAKWAGATDEEEEEEETSEKKTTEDDTSTEEDTTEEDTDEASDASEE